MIIRFVMFGHLWDYFFFDTTFWILGFEKFKKNYTSPICSYHINSFGLHIAFMRFLLDFRRHCMWWLAFYKRGLVNNIRETNVRPFQRQQCG